MLGNVAHRFKAPFRLPKPKPAPGTSRFEKLPVEIHDALASWLTSKDYLSLQRTSTKLAGLYRPWTRSSLFVEGLTRIANKRDDNKAAHMGALYQRMQACTDWRPSSEGEGQQKNSEVPFCAFISGAPFPSRQQRAAALSVWACGIFSTHWYQPEAYRQYDAIFAGFAEKEALTLSVVLASIMSGRTLERTHTNCHMSHQIRFEAGDVEVPAYAAYCFEKMAAFGSPVMPLRAFLPLVPFDGMSEFFAEEMEAASPKQRRQVTHGYFRDVADLLRAKAWDLDARKTKRDRWVRQIEYFCIYLSDQPAKAYAQLANPMLEASQRPDAKFLRNVALIGNFICAASPYQRCVQSDLPESAFFNAFDHRSYWNAVLALSPNDFEHTITEALLLYGQREERNFYSDILAIDATFAQRLNASIPSAQRLVRSAPRWKKENWKAFMRMLDTSAPTLKAAIENQIPALGIRFSPEKFFREPLM